MIEQAVKRQVSCPFVQEDSETRLWNGQEIGKCDGLVHVSGVGALTLRCRLVGDFIPSLHARFRIGRAHDCAFGNERINFQNPQFGRFLDQPVKTVSFRDCLSHHEPAP